MALGLFKAEMATGVLIGLAAAVLVPIVLPAAAVAVRPLARSAIKNGIIAFEKGREWLAEMGETLEDLVAEAQAELEHESYFGAETAEATATVGAAAGSASSRQTPPRKKAAKQRAKPSKRASEPDQEPAQE